MNILLGILTRCYICKTEVVITFKGKTNVSHDVFFRVYRLSNGLYDWYIFWHAAHAFSNKPLIR